MLLLMGLIVIWESIYDWAYIVRLCCWISWNLCRSKWFSFVAADSEGMKKKWPMRRDISANWGKSCSNLGSMMYAYLT